jgi:hypothetical protein
MTVYKTLPPKKHQKREASNEPSPVKEEWVRAQLWSVRYCMGKK